MNLSRYLTFVVIGYIVMFFVIGALLVAGYGFGAKYYLVTLFPDEKGLSQLGPFASEASCMNMARRLSELTGDMNAKDRQDTARMTVCVPAR